MTLAPSPTPLFQLDAITFRYPQSLALDSLSLEIVRGQRIAFLGANGSGKSTLLRLLAALQFPESGSLRFEGELLGEDRFADDDFAYAFRRRVGLVFQDSDAQLFNPTVYDEIAFGPLQLDLPKNEVRSRVDRMLEQFGIGDLAKRIPHHLSGGEKRKVALASILVMSPEVILLDEPTAGLDPRSQTQLVDLLMSWSDQSKTIIVATHDLHML